MPLTSTQEKRFCYISCQDSVIKAGQCICINNNINNMNFPWDKLEFKKVDPDRKAGTNPSGLILDEIGQMDFFKRWNQSHLLKNPKEGLKYQVKSYPDGSKYVVVEEIHSNLTFKLNSYEDLWILNQIHDVVKSAGWTVTVTIPNLIDAQADRRFDIDQPHGLKLVCEFLNGMCNFRFKIFHPHNSEVVEALIDNVEIIDNLEFVRGVIFDITKEDALVPGKWSPLKDNLVLMSSDAGGFKPLMKLVDKLDWKGETFSASKSRKYEDGHSKLIQQVNREDFEGKDILIIDDLMIGGSTFVGLAKMLKEKNVGKLYLAVSHITIQNPNIELLKVFDKIFTTNSKGLDYYKGSSIVKNKLEVINLF